MKRLLMIAVAFVLLASCSGDPASDPRSQIYAACDARHGEGTAEAAECGAVAYCAMEHPPGARLVGRGVDPLKLDGDDTYEYVSYSACVDPASLEEIRQACLDQGFSDCPNPDDYAPEPGA